ncbi:hypothetical protein C8R45DRAFT_942846 [Mycena sanguinolenta]|nr:hypothetical protein C8R45DRAFT_942846 [Mycena sanguinolenta]
MTDGSLKTIHRGSPANKEGVTSVKLNDNEIVSQISGFAGKYPYYNQSLLIQLTFVITDTSNGKIRVVGPLAATNGLADGKFFSVSNPLALGGFEQAGRNQVGISGLSIVKSNMVE